MADAPDEAEAFASRQELRALARTLRAEFALSMREQAAAAARATVAAVRAERERADAERADALAAARARHAAALLRRDRGDGSPDRWRVLEAQVADLRREVATLRSELPRGWSPRPERPGGAAAGPAPTPRRGSAPRATRCAHAAAPSAAMEPSALANIAAGGASECGARPSEEPLELRCARLERQLHHALGHAEAFRALLNDAPASPTTPRAARAEPSPVSRPSSRPRGGAAGAAAAPPSDYARRARTPRASSAGWTRIVPVSRSAPRVRAAAAGERAGRGETSRRSARSLRGDPVGR